MIERLVRFAVARRGWILAGWLLLAAGLAAIAVRLKLDALPDITSNQVQVLTRAPGLTPDEVEQRVTRPLETSFGGLAGLVEIRSLSRYGLSAITLVFEDDVDLLRARQLVAERMASSAGTRADGVDAPELGPMSGGLGEVFHFTLSAPTRTTAELLELVELRAAPILKTVPGVVEVNTWGGTERTLEVRAEPRKLVLHRVTFDELKVALERTVGSRPGAALESGERQLLLRGAFLPRTAGELAGALVEVRDGAAIRVGDVATVVEGAEPRIGAATRDGRGETVYVMAQMLIGANAREVTSGVRAKLAEVKATLPDDVHLDVVYDRSELVDATLRTVGKSLLEGGFLVCLVLFLMLGSARAGLIVAMTIPVAMIGSTAAMTLMGASGNLMSLGAVDFGLLVDGAVVLVEHVFHDRGADADASWSERVSRACSAVARPSFFGVAVILLVYVPVLSLTGVDGKLFRPMAVTVVLALLVALVFSLTFVPAAAAAFLRPRDLPARTPILARAIEALHAPLLARATRGAWLTLTLTGAVAALALALVLVSRMGTELAPTLDEGALVIQTTRHPDIGIEGAIERGSQLERALVGEVPEVRAVVSRIGSPAVATDIMGLEQADVFVELAPRTDWRPGLTREALLAELGARIEEGSPGSDPAFTQPIQMRFNELLGGAPFDVVVSVLGQDLASLRRTSEEALRLVSSIRGVEEPRVLAEDDIPLVQVTPASLAAAQRGLRVGEVLDLVGALRLGLDVGTTYDGPRTLPVKLRLGSLAPEPLGLERVPLPGPSGELVPLEAVAKVERMKAPAVLFRHNGERRMLLAFNVRGRELGEVVEEARQRIMTSINHMQGTRFAWGGQYETLQAARARLALVVPSVLLLVALVLFVHFRKGRPMMWVLAHVPFAAVGGVFALALRGMALSVSAGIGFIALWGIAVMNGTVLVTEIERLEGEGASSSEATLAATLSRARPVTMTALVAALGFLPMALASGVGSEVQRPLATVVIGGLVTSTSLTLLVLPALRIALSRRREQRRG